MLSSLSILYLLEAFGYYHVNLRNPPQKQYDHHKLVRTIITSDFKDVFQNWFVVKKSKWSTKKDQRNL